LAAGRQMKRCGRRSGPIVGAADYLEGGGQQRRLHAGVEAREDGELHYVVQDGITR